MTKKRSHPLRSAHILLYLCTSTSVLSEDSQNETATEAHTFVGTLYT